MTVAKRQKSNLDPTKVTKDFWVRASSGADGGVKYPNSGKWMLFTKVENHDQVWHTIRVATESGQLGYSAKAPRVSQIRLGLDLTHS